jgi:hypothetical protein
MANLCDLPDELLSEVIQQLDSIRSYEPQSTAFKYKEKERMRQRENRARQLTLHSLCLTSHRMRRLSLPTLYGSFLGCTTWNGCGPLELFCRTISNPQNAVGLQVRLRDYIRYVENRLSDYLGNSLHDDTEFYGAVSMVARYYELLATIVHFAPNLEHLSVVSLETDEVSFWVHIVPEDLGEGPTAASNLTDHGLRKLRNLCFQTHTEGSFGFESASFRRICSSLVSLPSLVDLRASGVMTSDISQPLPGSLEKLQRLNITECILDFEEVVQLLHACESLQDFTCVWTFLNCGAESPSDIYSGLIKHADRLETLELDMREVRFNYGTGINSEALGSLRCFQRLDTLVICETSLLGSRFSLLDFPDQILNCRMSELLPENLRHLTLLVQSDYGYEDDRRIDEASSLWHLVDDCKTVLPQLRSVTIKGEFEMSAPNLVAAFEDEGVIFTLTNELKLSTSF